MELEDRNSKEEAVSNEIEDEDAPLLTQEVDEETWEEIRVYRQRWFALFIFTANTFTNGMLFIQLSSINSVVSRYYDVSNVQIEWLSNMMNIGYAICALPATYFISRLGVKPVLIFGSFLHSLTAVLQYVGHVNNSFILITVGQVFSAVGSATVIQVPGKLSAVWFPENERATSTAIGFLANLLGIAFGFLHPTLIVGAANAKAKISHELEVVFTIRIFVCLFAMLLTLMYREKPATPSSPGPPRTHIPYIESINTLLRDKNFMFLTQAYAIYTALFSSMNTLINPIVTSKFQSYISYIGWMGFGSILTGMISFIVIGKSLDKWHNYRSTSIFLTISGFIGWLIFFTTLLYIKNFTVVFNIYVVFGFFIFPFFAGGIEQAAEMTYPVSEESSGVLLMTLSNVYAFLFNLAVGHALQNGYIHTSGFIVAGLYIVSTFFAYMTKTELKRFNAECTLQ